MEWNGEVFDSGFGDVDVVGWSCFGSHVLGFLLVLVLVLVVVGGLHVSCGWSGGLLSRSSSTARMLLDRSHFWT